MVSILKKTLLRKLREHIRGLDKEGLYSVCTSKYFIEKFNNEDDVDELIKLFNKGKKCDDMFPMKKSTGKQIEELAENNSITLAGYEDKSTDLKSNCIREKINRGIEIGDDELNASHLEETLEFGNDLIDLLKILKSSKNGKFLLSFPVDVIKNNGCYMSFSFDEIYNVEGNKQYIRPEYIDSYISFYQDTMKRIPKKDLENNLVKKIKPTE